MKGTFYYTMAKLSTAQQDLVNLKEGYDRIKHPNLPDYARIKPKYEWTTTNGITYAIIEYIDLRGGWATRISTEGRFIESLGKRVQSSVKKGTPDIMGVYLGRHLGIEVKNGSDKMSDKQIQVQLDMVRAGSLYCIAKSFDHFHEWFHKQDFKQLPSSSISKADHRAMSAYEQPTLGL